MARKSKKRDVKKYNILTFSIVIMVLLLSIVLIEVITITLENRYQSEIIEKNSSKDISKVTYYDTSSLKFVDIYLSSDISDLSSSCSKGCNLSIEEYDTKYKYIISKSVSGEYLLDIVLNNQALYRGISLGYSIEDLYIKEYKDLVLLYNIYSNRHFKYDYIIVVDKNGNKDEFSSVNENEITLTVDGITYTYDTCFKTEEGNATITKALRYPFTSDVKVLSTENTTFEWCN